MYALGYGAGRWLIIPATSPSAATEARANHASTAPLASASGSESSQPTSSPTSARCPISRGTPADPSLEQLISITPVRPGPIADQLNADLDDMLGRLPADAADYMAPSVPTARHDDYLAAESLKVKSPMTPL